MNKRLYQLFQEDQNDRKNIDFNKFSEVEKRDTLRRKKVSVILQKNIQLTGQDYFYASMIFQHGPKISDSKKAIKYAKEAIQLGFNDAKWLFAAATDRLLTKQGKKQKFGTQYKQVKGEWRLFPVNSKTTDEERAEYNVKPLREAIKRAKSLNKKPKPNKHKIGLTQK